VTEYLNAAAAAAAAAALYGPGRGDGPAILPWPNKLTASLSFIFSSCHCLSDFVLKMSALLSYCEIKHT